MEQRALMDYELISYALGLAIFGGFVWALGYVSFKQGLEVGKRLSTLQTGFDSRIRRRNPASESDGSSQASNQSGLQSTQNQRICAECGELNKHAKDCPLSQSKPDRRRWMGFSRIKAELESKESA